MASLNCLARARVIGPCGSSKGSLLELGVTWDALKEASRLYTASWVRDIGPDLRPNDYKKDDRIEGKSNGDKSRSTEIEPLTLEDFGEELYFVVSYLEMF
ncbi:hypothetical protein GOBAR_AA26046 [Gossypium barbadense]|uniref:Uncharacterized protein n=1 Tax=Gossypium barbadense TaxID=3634 RepID=A0A2P5WU54_GOSBA|nr:hypothetical protein GOBAR_AA26046 [Gossypium barbadense]